MLSRVFIWGCSVVLAISFVTSCATTSSEKREHAPEIKSEPLPAPPPGIPLKAYHHDMREEMQKSYERADKIIVGVYSGNHLDDQNQITYYFDNFTSFDKEFLGWGPVMNVLFSAHSPNLKPEIITQQELRSLFELDKVGICWDFYEQKRYMYLVEGQQMLVFLEQVTDETDNTIYWNLIDIYPVTEECNAKAVFNWMLRDQS